MALGHKTGGRQKGTPNKLSASVRQRLEELGCDPIAGMADIAMDENNTPELRGKMHAELAQYAYPRLKAIDHTFGGDKSLNVNVSGTELLTSRVASLAAKIGMGSGDTKPE